MGDVGFYGPRALLYRAMIAFVSTLGSFILYKPMQYCRDRVYLSLLNLCYLSYLIYRLTSEPH